MKRSNHTLNTLRLLAACSVCFFVAAAIGRATPSHAPVVIFKLDDLRDTPKARDGFDQVFAVLQEKKVCAGFGIIADSCEGDQGKQSYYDLLRKWTASGRIEIWHHGYDHVQGEFSDGNVARQQAHLQKANQLLKEKCGITLRSFGSPFNAGDEATVQALNAVPQLEVWMLPHLTAGAKQRLLTTRCNMEPKPGVVDYDLFVREFTAHAGEEYLIVQGHPPYWSEASHAAFARIVDYCVAHGCAFAMPAGYAKPAQAGKAFAK